MQCLKSLPKLRLNLRCENFVGTLESHYRFTLSHILYLSTARAGWAVDGVRLKAGLHLFATVRKQ